MKDLKTLSSHLANEKEKLCASCPGFCFILDTPLACGNRSYDPQYSSSESMATTMGLGAQCIERACISLLGCSALLILMHVSSQALQQKTPLRQSLALKLLRSVPIWMQKILLTMRQGRSRRHSVLPSPSVVAPLLTQNCRLLLPFFLLLSLLPRTSDTLSLYSKCPTSGASVPFTGAASCGVSTYQGTASLRVLPQERRNKEQIETSIIVFVLL